MKHAGQKILDILNGALILFVIAVIVSIAVVGGLAIAYVGKILTTLVLGVVSPVSFWMIVAAGVIVATCSALGKSFRKYRDEKAKEGT